MKIWDLFLLIQLLSLLLLRYRSPYYPSMISVYWSVLRGVGVLSHINRNMGANSSTCAVHLTWGRLHPISYFIICSTNSIIKLLTVKDQGQTGGRIYDIILDLKLLAFICSQICWYIKWLLEVLMTFWNSAQKDLLLQNISWLKDFFRLNYWLL